MKLVKHSQIMVSLSVNVITKKNNQEKLVTWNLIRLTNFLFMIYSLMQIANQQMIRFEQGTDNILGFCESFYLISTIILKSVTYGLGL